ncbi:MAG: hypothetical protein ACFB9M_13060 [Myxococcota bacterium]
MSGLESWLRVLELRRARAGRRLHERRRALRSIQERVSRLERQRSETPGDATRVSDWKAAHLYEAFRWAETHRSLSFFRSERDRLGRELQEELRSFRELHVSLTLARGVQDRRCRVQRAQASRRREQRAHEAAMISFHARRPPGDDGSLADCDEEDERRARPRIGE